ncbi:hypothetical protein E8E13_006931 [Curvularia kusanoi]|uniref:Peroxisome assembly protein 12 n=1 Tax=Curvularia kusanoi TaxID=90978 RepID=A0A9P4TGX9_CURKU|nr:hypothetical protein E8E13_006931 [Curvularia kusanoi]
MEFLPTLQSGVDDLKPSLFELLSEQQLSALLPPSLRYLLAVATPRYPRYLLPVLNSFDEVYALVMLLVERHFLRTYGGSFTENFYSMKRARVLRVRGGEIPRAQLGAAESVREASRLTSGDIWKNLAVLVGLPWLKRKLDEGYDVHAAHSNLLGPGYNRDRDGLPTGATIKQRLMFWYKWFLRNIYPSVNAAYYFSLLVFNMAYLFDSTKYHSPFLWMIGTRIRRLGPADHAAIEALTAPKAVGPARPGEGGSIFSPRNLARTVQPRLLSSLKILLPTSIFALKFLEWWHASDFARQLSRKAAENIELPPPVLPSLPPSSTATSKPSKSQSSDISTDKSAQESKPKRIDPPIAASSLLPILTVSLPPDSSLCPICMTPIVNPTASPTGYVYCYTCIHRWVDASAKALASAESPSPTGYAALDRWYTRFNPSTNTWVGDVMGWTTISTSSVLEPTIIASLRSSLYHNMLPERRHGDDDSRRRVHGNADMPLNRSRLTLSPDHIASAMRDMTFSNDPAASDLAASLAALHRARQAAQQTPSTSRSPSPEDPRDISAPLHIFQRRSTAPELSSNTDDTRRHGVVIQDALPLHPPPSPSPPPHDNPDDDLTSSASSISSEPLPSYTPLPPRPTRRMTSPGTPTPTPTLNHPSTHQSRQRELLSLRRQWVQHTRRSSSAPLTARTHYRAPIAQSHDLPPPYAPTDPYPLYASLPSPHCPPEPSSNSNKPSLWARAVLYPFVPEGVLLDKAAGVTERACAKVKFRVKKGVLAIGNAISTIRK